LVPLGVENPLAPSAFPEKDEKSGWTNKSRRTGLLAMKVGMYHEFNNWGLFIPLTVLQVCFVFFFSFFLLSLSHK